MRYPDRRLYTASYGNRTKWPSGRRIPLYFSTKSSYEHQSFFIVIPLFSVGNKISVSNKLFLANHFYSELYFSTHFWLKSYLTKIGFHQKSVFQKSQNGLFPIVNHIVESFENFFDECQFQSGNCELVMHLRDSTLLYLGEISSWVLILNHDRGSALFFLFWKSLQKY